MIGYPVLFRTGISSDGEGRVSAYDAETDTVTVIDDEDGSAWRGSFDHVRLYAIAFVHEGQLIKNPFLSPDRSHVVDPVTYGFREGDTGGGCVCLDFKLPDGGVIRLTDETGCALPTLEDWPSALVGLYDAQGDEVECKAAERLPGLV